jgi:hypothetical protein
MITRPTSFSQENYSDLERLTKLVREAVGKQEDAYKRTIETVGVPATDADDIIRVTAIEDALWDRAAVVGDFEPGVLCEGLTDDPVAGLSTISSACEIVVGEYGARRWRLQRRKRRDLLADLWKEPSRTRLDAALEATHPTDAAGRHLAYLLQHSGPAPATDTDDLRGLVQALDWTAGVVADDEQVSEARRQLALSTMHDNFRRLLKDGFFGRNAQVARFENFLAEPRATHPTILSVTGVGGMGKSSFLAYVASKLLDDHRPDAPIVISIDFDRFGLSPSGLYELTFELLRQLGRAAPMIDGRLAALRAEVRAQTIAEADVGSALESVHGSSERGRNDILYRAVPLLIEGGITARTVVVLLDTFEEAQSSEKPYWASSKAAHAESQIAGWLQTIGDVLGDVRAIICGRASIGRSPELKFLLAPAPIVLGDLEPGDRIDLLQNLKVPPEVAVVLAEHIGGNPLLLRIGARLVQRLSDDERSEFLNDPALATRSGDFVAQFLYDRLLRHLKDARVARLAHPGLALRRVTTGLIHNVLADCCELGPVNKSDAENLYEALRDAVWLVDEEGRHLVHRPDLRRLMLKLMAGDSGLAYDQVQRIHRAACLYHAARGDPDLTDDQQAREELYHRLMSADGSESDGLTDAQLREVGEGLGGERALLHPQVRARLQAALGESLSLEAALALPDDGWTNWANAEGKRLVDDADDPAPAAALLQRRPISAEFVPAWWLRAMDGAGQWHHPSLGAVLDRARLFRTIPMPRSSATEQAAFERADDLVYEMVSSWSRAARLAFRRAEYRLIIEIAEQALREDAVPSLYAYRPDVVAARTILVTMAQVAAAAIADGRGDETTAGDVIQSTDRYNANMSAKGAPKADMRRMAAVAPYSRARFLEVIAPEPLMFVPDPEWLESVARVAGREAYSERFPPLSGKETTRELLGTRAALWAKEIAPSDWRFAAADPALLRGSDPWLRPAARNALRHAFREDAAALFEVAQAMLPFVPADLGERTFGDHLRPEVVYRLVEFADRSLRLDRLLTEAARRRPSIQPLDRVAETTARWCNALRAACDIS